MIGDAKNGLHADIPSPSGLRPEGPMPFSFQADIPVSSATALSGREGTSIATEQPLIALTCVASVYTTAAGIHVQSNVLVIGGGGREHALAWKLGQSPSCETLYCAPGNPGIASESAVSAVPDLNVDDHKQVTQFCKDKGIDFVVVGPEAPLVDGIVDSLSDAGVPAFGPTKAAASLEGSKAFMKNLCKKYSIPTAESETFTTVAEAHSYIDQRGAPIVVKASGLAAGKGVIVAETVEEAKEAASSMLEGGQFGDAGSKIVIEDFLNGEEASFFALIDGNTVIPFGSAQDHKAAYDGDKGPNTGGMGAYSPAPVLTPEIEKQVWQR